MTIRQTFKDSQQQMLLASLDKLHKIAERIDACGRYEPIDVDELVECAYDVLPHMRSKYARAYETRLGNMLFLDRVTRSDRKNVVAAIKDIMEV